MRYGFINNFQQTLAAALAEGATILSLNDGGAQLADASTDYRYKLTLIQRDAFGTETHREIVDVTAASGNDLTIEGAKEGTTRLAGGWPSGTAVEARVTAEVMGSLAPEPTIRSEHIELGPLDFANAGTSASHTLEAGRRLFVDSVDVIPTASGQADGWYEVSGIDVPGLGRGTELAWNNDKSKLAVARLTSSVVFSVYATADWSRDGTTPVPSGSGYAVAYNQAGTLLAVGHGDSPYLTIYDPSDWSVVSTVTLAGRPDFLAFSNDDTMLAAAHPGGNGVSIIDTSTWSIIAGTPTLTGNGLALAWNSTDTQLAVTDDVPSMYVFNVADWTTLHSEATPGDAYGIQYSPDDTQLAAPQSSGTVEVHIWAVSDWSLTTSTLGLGQGFMTKVQWMDAGARMAIALNTPDGEMVGIFDVATWALEESFMTGSTPWSLAVDDVANVIAVGVASSPYFRVFEYLSSPTPALNLGVSSGTPDSLLAAQALEAFVDGDRISADVAHKTAVTTLYAEPANTSAAGATAVVVVHGYSMES